MSKGVAGVFIYVMLNKNRDYQTHDENNFKDKTKKKRNQKSGKRKYD